jgi:hypothetical protein
MKLKCVSIEEGRMLYRQLMEWVGNGGVIAIEVDT